MPIDEKRELELASRVELDRDLRDLPVSGIKFG